MNIHYDVEHLDAEGLLPVMTATSMREADAFAIENLRMGSLTLMETAGRACAATAVEMLRASGGVHATVLCGKGNNGGDGYVVARQLILHGFAVRVVSTAGRDELSPDARQQFRLLEELAREVAPDVLALEEYAVGTWNASASDLWIDALLGTGLSEDLREPYLTIVKRISDADVPVLAVDIPTGIEADTGRALGAAVKADVTVTMGAVKAGMLFGDGPEHCGRIEVAEIGIPRSALADKASASMTTDLAVARWLPQRAPDAHKYTAGMVLVIGGSEGMTGAPVLTARAAARSGAGYVMVACPESVQPTLATKLTTVTSVGLPVAPDGGIDAERAIARLRQPLERATAVALGPGLGRSESTIDFVDRLLRDLDKPVVIDADALYALSQRTELLERSAKPSWILTPHRGEFARLVHGDSVSTNPIEEAREYASRWKCTLLLKGMPSVVASAEGRTFVGGAGSNALATAGTGDVLTGLSASLSAQGLAPHLSAAAALHLGGAASDAYVARSGAASMIATDLIRILPRLLKTRFNR